MAGLFLEEIGRLYGKTEPLERKNSFSYWGSQPCAPSSTDDGAVSVGATKHGTDSNRLDLEGTRGTQEKIAGGRRGRRKNLFLE